MPAFQRVFFFSNFLNHAFSYKAKKAKAPQIYLLCGAFAIKIEIII